MKVDKQLLNKYNVPVPRYTSYPPANHFTDDFKESDFKHLLVKSNEEHPHNIAFYIHIPFCAQICHYCGCNALKMGRAEEIKNYIAALKKEISLIISHINKDRKISQIHYGGGTPNAIKANYLKEINDILFEAFDVIDNAEIAIECNPAHLSYSYLDELFEAGFNRFSFGIQDFDECVLKDVNRKPSALPVGDLVRYVKTKNKGFAVNLDFIYGLPGQTAESFCKSIQQAIEIRPDRLVTFSYAHVPWFKEHQKILDAKGLPTADDKLDMFLSAYDLLLKAGYVSIGLDHYALPEDELCLALNKHQLHRNFQGYCTKRTTGQVYAVGVSSISQLSGGYAQNTKSVKEYVRLINENIIPVEKGVLVSNEQKIIRTVINELMCNKFIDWNIVAENLRTNVASIKKLIAYDQSLLEQFKEDGFIDYTEQSIGITELGTMFIRNIVASFDPALRTGNKRYSNSL
ncbi:oxygen-independent coproporphyrinogen III oxidase [Saccharicrinis fermentans]|uniref:Coproporphyrinogen-III oxidase n=1 Tax=Saccharicrinis fermentans DSM 9555 = JCM 21142 TaxID=869213 RepID=W7Y9U4_9BACT|nr:oxygen-independent coproporphyrinogen III oxidase [Saccharicrinis fermentans]GAF04293.1 oxygen-independent coproporphyrinogen-III oxidase [Saccharicrinis fermentans DSM 9555 = JCM 21142]